MNDKTNLNISDIFTLYRESESSLGNLTELLDDLNLTDGTIPVDDTHYELTHTQREYLIKVKEGLSYTTKRYWIDTILSKGGYTEGDRARLNALKEYYQ